MPSTLRQKAMARLSRQVLRFLAPDLDASPAEGGLGPHPLGAGGRTPWWSALPEDDALGGAALLAESSPEEATRLVLAWLDADTPGTGASWAAVDVVAIRLIHLAAFHAWVNTEAGLSERIAGSARAHAAWVFAELPIDESDPVTALCHAALLIAGQAWPALEDARRWRGPALAGLPASLSATVGDDGASTAPPVAAARTLWAAALARAWVEAGGGAFPREADAALARGALALWRVGGDVGLLPTTPLTPLLPLGPAPLSHTLRNLTLAWELDDGAPASTDDAACALLASAPQGPPEVLSGTDWRLWTWRGSGTAAAHRIIKKQPSRVWYSAPQQRLDWSLDEGVVVSGSLPAGTLRVGRVDGNQATLIHEGASGVVDLRMRQARLSITQSGSSEVAWDIPTDWELTPSDKGGYTGKKGRTTLVVKLDPAWQWSLSGSRLVGRGDPERVKYSFELR